MKKIKLKRVANQIVAVTKSIFSFYFIWITIILVILSIISLKISLYYNSINNDFYASMYSNIFSGIIVGLVVLFITGFKNLQKYNLESKIKKMQEIHKEILEYNNMYKKLVFNKEINYEDVAYDLICLAQSINTEISSETLSKKSFAKFFLKEFSFDVTEKSKECYNIREIILYDINSANYRKDVNEHLDNYGRQLLLLNREILIKIRDYNSKIKIIDTSIL